MTRRSRAGIRPCGARASARRWADASVTRTVVGIGFFTVRLPPPSGSPSHTVASRASTRRVPRTRRPTCRCSIATASSCTSCASTAASAASAWVAARRRLARAHAGDRRRRGPSLPTHDGVDWRALVGAALARMTGGPARGASTITMQLAALLDPSLAARGAGPRRSARSSARCGSRWALERSWSKDEILEAYLNLRRLSRRAPRDRRRGGVRVRQGAARARRRRVGGARGTRATPERGRRPRGAPRSSDRRRRRRHARRGRRSRRPRHVSTPRPRASPRPAARPGTATWRRTSRTACSPVAMPRVRRRSTPACSGSRATRSGVRSRR